MRKSRKKWEKVWKSWKKWGKLGISGEKVGISDEKCGKVWKSWKKCGKVGISGEKWGKVAKSWKNTQLFCLNFFFKMAAGLHFGSPFWVILDDRKSLSIAFLAISDQYATFFFEFVSEVRFAPKTIGFFHYVLSMAIPNMKLIGEFCDTVRDATSFLSIFIQNGRQRPFCFSD